MNPTGGKITWILDADSARFISTMQASENAAQKTASTIDKTLSSVGDSAKKSLRELGYAFEDTGRKLSIYISTPIAAGLGVAVSSAGKFESSISQLGNAADANASQLARLSAKARELGADSTFAGVSAADAAEAMVELSKAGLSVNDVLGASRGVLSLAKAGQISFGQAAITTASALNAFQLAGDKAGYVADVLANGANKSQASLADLGLGLQQASSVAQLFGLNVEETVTALSIFANNGIRASDAGTSLKTMLVSLATPSKQAAQLMEDIGFSAYDAQGNFVSLRELSNRLAKSLKGLTEEQRQQTLGTIFGTDAIRSATLLAQNAGQSYDEMAAAISRTGTAQRTAAAQLGPFQKSLEGLKNTLSEAGLQIGEILLPALTNLFKQVTKGVAFFNNLNDTQQVLIIGFGIFAASLGPVIFSMGLVFDLSRRMIGTFQGLVKVIGFVSVGFNSLSAGLAGTAVTGNLASVALNKVGFALTALAKHPFLIIFTVIATALIFLEERFNIVEKAIKFLTPAFEELARILKPITDIYFKNMNDALKALNGLFEFLKQPIKEVRDIFVSLYNTALKPVFESFGKFIADHADSIKSFFSFLIKVSIGFIAVQLGVVILALAAAFKVLEIVVRVIIGVFEGIKKAAELVVQAFKDPVGTIKTFVSSIKDNLVGGLENIKNAVKGPVDSIKSNIEDRLNKSGINVDGFKKDFLGSLQNTLDGALDRINKYNDSMRVKVVESFNNFKTESLGKLSESFDSIKNSFSTAIGRVGDGVNLFVDGIVKYFSKLPGKIVEKFEDTKKMISEFFSDLPGNLSKSVQSSIEGIVKFFSDIPGSIRRSMGGIQGFFSGLFDGQKEGEAVANKVVDGVKQGLSTQDKIRKIGDTIVQLVGAAMLAVGFYLTDAGIRGAGKIVEGFADGLKQLPGQIGSGVLLAAQTVTNFSNTFNQAGATLISFLISGMISTISGVSSSIAGGLNSANSTISSYGNSFFNQGVNIISRFISGIAGSLSGIGNTIRNGIQGGINVINGYIGEFYNAGMNLILGMARGIANGTSGLINQAKSAAQSAADAVKKTLGIRSPSKVMAEMGAYMMEGLANGIEDQTRLAVRAASDAAGSVLGAMSSLSSDVAIGSQASSGLAPAMYSTNRAERVQSGERVSIVQYNTVNTDLDMNQVNRNLAWELNKI